MLNEKHLYLINLLFFLFMLCLKVAVRTVESERKQEKQHFLEGDISNCLLIAVRNWDPTVKFNNSSVSGKHKIERWYCTVPWNERLCWEHLFDIKTKTKIKTKQQQNKYSSERNKYLFKTPEIIIPKQSKYSSKMYNFAFYQLGKRKLSNSEKLSLSSCHFPLKSCFLNPRLRHIGISISIFPLPTFLIWFFFIPRSFSFSNHCLLTKYMLRLQNLFIPLPVFVILPFIQLNVYLFPFPFIPLSSFSIYL